MLGTVALSQRHVEDYRDVIGDDAVAELRVLAEPLRGVRIVNLSLAAFGTWVSELLSVSVPLLLDLGIDASWFVLRTDQSLSPDLRTLYDALNGITGRWDHEQRQAWEQFSGNARESLEREYDVAIVHDPQLVGAAPDRMFSRNGGGRQWVWHCHLDLSAADPAAWHDLRRYLDRFDAVAFEDLAFVPRDLLNAAAAEGVQPAIIPPGIDPLGPRNVSLDREAADLLVTKLGIDPRRPLIAQVSPFDEGSDVHGLIEVFDALRERWPGLQLAIVPTALRDDQETRTYFDRIAGLTKERPGCLLLPLAQQIGNTEVNAVEQSAAVVVQKSLRRGFALWLSEVMWKARPIVAGRTAGTVAQVQDGVTGFLVPDTATCVERVNQLLSDAVFAERMGAAGRQLVRERFLVTRYLADTLRWLARVVGATQQPIA